MMFTYLKKRMLIAGILMSLTAQVVYGSSIVGAYRHIKPSVKVEEDPFANKEMTQEEAIAWLSNVPKLQSLSGLALAGMIATVCVTRKWSFDMGALVALCGSTYGSCLWLEHTAQRQADKYVINHIHDYAVLESVGMKVLQSYAERGLLEKAVNVFLKAQPNVASRALEFFAAAESLERNKKD